MTTPTDLLARLRAVLTAAEAMTPGPCLLRRFVDNTGNDAAAVIHAVSGETIATCDGEDRSDEARPVCDAAGLVALRNATADLAALLALVEAPAPLTVGAALALPEVRRGEFVVEYDRPRVQKVEQMGWFRDGLDADFRGRSRHIDEPWAEWRNNDRGVWPGILDIFCRLVPLTDADRDPNERGPL